MNRRITNIYVGPWDNEREPNKTVYIDVERDHEDPTKSSAYMVREELAHQLLNAAIRRGAKLTYTTRDVKCFDFEIDEG